MSRPLWFVAGAGAGAYAMVRARRAAEALTADGLRDRMGALSVGLRMFRDEVATGSAERETELRRRYGLRPHGRPELGPGTVSTDPARATSPTTDDPEEGRP